MSSALGLSRARSEDLKRLLRALHRGSLPSPITRSSLIEAAFGHIEGALDPIVGRDTTSAQVLIACVLAERTQHKAASDVALSFCAAAAPSTRSRDLSEQVRELIGGAERSITLVGVKLDEEHRLFKTLRALLEGRDLTLELFLDNASEHDAREFLDQHLPKRERVRVRLAVERALRARAVIVDEARILVTSGELTTEEDDGFIDVGVRFTDASYIAHLRAEWEQLERAGILVPV